MRTLHDDFAAWLIDGARGDPARDVAVHASACPDCLRIASAHDALVRIDPGGASAPSAPPIAAAGRLRRPSWILRVGASAGAVLLATIVGIAASGTLIRLPTAAPVGEPTPSPRGAVLGEAGGATPLAADTRSPQRSSSATERPSPGATTDAAPLPGAPPVVVPPPPAGQPGPPAPLPTPTPTPAATSPSSAPSTTPSPSVSPPPSPSPTIATDSPAATPSPCESDCSPPP